MGRPRLHDEQLRQRLLDAATDLMAAEGPDFSLRPLVASVGTSTSAVYSLFGSRGELVEAITLRAVRSFVDAQLDARTVGVSLDRLRGAKKAIFVTAGPAKHDIARTVVTSGLCGVLVTDETTARALLEER